MDNFSFNNLAYPEKVYKFWKDEKLCDITLISGLDKTRVLVHRLVLSASTDFFDGLLTSEFKEQHHNEIVVNNISGPTLQTVIHFFYTGTIEISSENAESLLAAASFLLSPQLQRKCTEYFEQLEIIDASNCIGIWAVANKYSFHEIKTAASDVIHEQFLEVSKNEEFFRLNETDVVELLGSDQMNINSEEDVFNAVVNWVRFGVEERKFLFPAIVRVVRIHQLNEKFMMRHVSRACNQFECLSTWMDLCLAKTDTKSHLGERVSVTPKLLAINYGKTTSEKIEIFSVRLQTWKNLDNIEIDKYYFGAEVVGTHLYIIGGRSNERTPVECFNLQTRERRELQPMIQPRWNPSIIYMNGEFYAVGGVNQDYLNTVEKYEIEANTWTPLASTSIQRAYAEITNLSGKLFVIGGRSAGGCLSSVECYDPATNAWSNVASMITKRVGARAGVVNGSLYVVGGFDGSHWLSTIERYDQQRNEWTMLNFQLNIARRDFGMTLSQGWIFVAGGSGCEKASKTCEQLNVLTGKKKDVLPMLFRKVGCYSIRSNNNNVFE